MTLDYPVVCVQYHEHFFQAPCSHWVVLWSSCTVILDNKRKEALLWNSNLWIILLVFLSSLHKHYSKVNAKAKCFHLVNMCYLWDKYNIPESLYNQESNSFMSCLLTQVTFSLYSSFIMQQLKKVGGSSRGICSALVIVWLLQGGTQSALSNRMSFVCTVLFDCAANVCFSHKYDMGAKLCAESLSTWTENFSASPVWMRKNIINLQLL